MLYFNQEKEREDVKMKKSTRGWYIYQDGYKAWYNGMSKNEKAWEELKHGKIIQFIPTN